MLTTEFCPWCWWPWGPSKIDSAMCLHTFTCLHPHCTCSHISVDPDLLKSFTQRASVLHEVLRNEAQVSMLLKEPTYHAFLLINVSGNWSTSRAPTPCTGVAEMLDVNCALFGIYMLASLFVCCTPFQVSTCTYPLMYTQLQASTATQSPRTPSTTVTESPHTRPPSHGNELLMRAGVKKQASMKEHLFAKVLLITSFSINSTSYPISVIGINAVP